MWSLKFSRISGTLENDPFQVCSLLLRRYLPTLLHAWPYSNEQDRKHFRKLNFALFLSDQHKCIYAILAHSRSSRPLFECNAKTAVDGYAPKSPAVTRAPGKLPWFDAVFGNAQPIQVVCFTVVLLCVDIERAVVAKYERSLRRAQVCSLS
jgi:hypothetical protein